MSYDNIALSGLRRTVMEVEPNDGADLENKIENFGDQYIIQIPKGTYNLSDEILLEGSGAWPATKTYIIRGAGTWDTIIVPNGTDYGFRGIDAVNVFLSDLEILIPASNGMPGIFGDDGGGAWDYSFYRGDFRNIAVRGGGSTNDLVAVHLQNPYEYIWTGNNYISVDGVYNASPPTGIKIENTSAGNRCDGWWGGLMQIYMSGANQTAVDFARTANEIHGFHMLGYTYISNPTSDAGTTAFDLDYVTNSSFANFSLEYMANGFVMDNCDSVHIYDGGYIQMRDAGILFDVNSTNTNIIVKDIGKVNCAAAETLTLLDDDVGDAMLKSIYDSIRVTKGAGATVTVSPHANTNVRRITIYDDGVSEARGTATILNGNATVVVTHGLYSTPLNIKVDGTHAEVESCYPDTIGAANFTINKGGAGNVTANRDIFWEASVCGSA